MNTSERVTQAEHEELMSTIKDALCNLLDSQFPKWGLTEEDLIVVGEIGFGLAGIPVIGPHLSRPYRAPHLEAYILDKKYQGPKVDEEKAEHPGKVALGLRETKRIRDQYGLEIMDFLVADSDILFAPKLWVDIGGKRRVQTLEPKTGVSFFADRTILFFTQGQKGIEKIKEWYDKLLLIEQAALRVGRDDVVEVCRQKIALAKKRWAELI
jgi:hypothetical protein